MLSFYFHYAISLFQVYALGTAISDGLKTRKPRLRKLSNFSQWHSDAVIKPSRTRFSVTPLTLNIPLFCLPTGGKQALTAPSRAELTPRRAGGRLKSSFAWPWWECEESTALKVVRLSGLMGNQLHCGHQHVLLLHDSYVTGLFWVSL